MWQVPRFTERISSLIMAALWNRTGHYILPYGFFILLSPSYGRPM